MAGGRLLTPRALAAYYFWYFAAVGIFEPFLAPWWRQLGFRPAQIGALQAILPAVGCLAPFLWTAYADATRRGEGLFRLNSGLAAVTGLLLPALTSVPTAALALLLFAAVRAPLIPLANAMSFAALRGRRQGYAAIRLWGTLGYIVTAVLAGPIVDRVGLRPALFGIGLTLALCGAIAAAAPRGEPAPLAPVRLRDILGSLRDRRLLLLVVSAGLAWTSYGPYAAFFTIHLDRLGFSRSFAGVAWASAATSELVVMLVWSRLAPRCRPRTWLLLGLGANPLRWLLAAGAASAPLVLAVQALHAFSFGVFYLTAVERVDALAPPGTRASAQGLFAAATFGLGGLLGSLGGGLLYEPLGLDGLYLVMAAVSASGTVLYWAATGSSAAPRAGVKGAPR